MGVVTARVPDEYLKDLRRIEREEYTDRAEVVRKFLAEGISNWKKKKAAEQLREGKITIRQAASLAGISYAEVLDLMVKEDIDMGYSTAELEKDTERI